MDEQLRKRIEEDANKYINNHSNYLCSAFLKDRLKEAYAAGAEYGYKEAIAMAKEWLKEHSHIGARMIGSVRCTSLMTQGELLADFEADMNKLWEDEK